MKTVKKTAAQVKIPRYEVSVPGGDIFSTNDKELAVQEIEKLKLAFASKIYFDDHKEKQHWIYEIVNNQKNYRAFIGHYIAFVRTETPAIES